MQNAAMIEFLQNYRCLVDTNVWLKGSFRSAVAQSAPLLGQLRVPYLVMDELKRKKDGSKQKDLAAAAIKFIQERNIEVLPTPTVSHSADREIIIYCMEHLDEKIILITEDKNLTKDLKDLCPQLPILNWDIQKKEFTADGAPGDAKLVQSYGKVLASRSAAQRADFPQRMVQLRCAGVKEVLMPTGSLLARAIVNDDKKRALLLLEEGEDSTPYMDFRNKKLKSVDNTGFDVAFMDANGQIEVHEPLGGPLPKRQVNQAKAEKTATAVNNNTPTEIDEALMKNLKERKFAAACALMDDAKKAQKPLDKKILNFYLNEVLGEFAVQSDWNTLMTLFTGKEEKKAFKQMIAQTDGTNTVGIVRPKLNNLRKHCETEAQRKAIDSIIDAAQKKN